jgi:hypothetical protein
MRLPSMAKARKICQELKAIRKAGAIRALANALDYAALLRFMHKALAARAELDSVIGRFAPDTDRTTFSPSFMGKTFWKKNVTANQRMQATRLRPVDPLTLATCR